MMTILSPAKINLFLEVGHLDKRTELHQIVSLVDIIDLCDTIEIEESERTEVHFTSRWQIPDENTVTRTISLIKNTFQIKKNVKVVIRKKIPPGSGLGGGSSNAAAVLNALVYMWDIDTKDEYLRDMGLMIGSDVPLFLGGKRCIIEGVGDRVKSRGISSVPLFYCLLIPPFGISTGEIYRHLNIQGDLTLARQKIKILNECIETKDMQGIEKNMFNRLQGVYLDLYKEGKEVMKKVEGKTGKRFFVSGSGGTLFTVFADRREAEEKMASMDISGWKGYVVESKQ